MPSLVCPTQLSEEAILAFPASLPTLEFNNSNASLRLASADTYSKLSRSYSDAAIKAKDLLRTMRRAWEISQQFHGVVSTDVSFSIAVGSCTFQSEPEAAALTNRETSTQSSRELSAQIEILNAQLRGLEGRLTLQRNDVSAQPISPIASGSNVFPAQEAVSDMKRIMAEIKACVLSGTVFAAHPLGVDECLINIACGFLRRDENYLKDVFQKHCNDHQSGETGLLKESMRAALKDAHFPLFCGALAASDDELMRQVDVDSSGRVSFEEFRQFVLQRGSVENWMKTERFLQILSDSVAPLLGLDGGSDDQMHQLAKLSPNIFRRALDAAMIGFDMQFQLSHEKLQKIIKAVTAQTERLSQSKFEVVSKLACGSIDDFHKGLESRIGRSHDNAFAVLLSSLQALLVSILKAKCIRSIAQNLAATWSLPPATTTSVRPPSRNGCML
jgi:hypothetical protein